MKKAEFCKAGVSRNATAKGRRRDWEVNMRTRINNTKSDDRGAITASFLLAIMFVGAVAIFFLNSGSCPFSSASKPTSTVEDKGAAAAPAADFSLKDPSGNEVKLSNYKGQVVVLNFWATWCGPCRAEIPSFIKVREQLHDRGVEVIGVSLDQDDQQGIAEFARRFGINYPVVTGTMETVEAYGGMNAIPTTFFIDRQGRVASRHLGMLSLSEIEGAIKSLL